MLRKALRYRIFYERLALGRCPKWPGGAATLNRFDGDCDHLLVLDHTRGAGAQAIVGTYRLIRRETAARLGGFYSADEYDIAPLLRIPGEILELGRSCVDTAIGSGRLCSCCGAVSRPTFFTMRSS